MDTGNLRYFKKPPTFGPLTETVKLGQEPARPPLFLSNSTSRALSFFAISSRFCCLAAGEDSSDGGTLAYSGKGELLLGNGELLASSCSCHMIDRINESIRYH